MTRVKGLKKDGSDAAELDLLMGGVVADNSTPSTGVGSPDGVAEGCGSDSSLSLKLGRRKPLSLRGFIIIRRSPAGREQEGTRRKRKDVRIASARKLYRRNYELDASRRSNPFNISQANQCSSLAPAEPTRVRTSIPFGLLDQVYEIKRRGVCVVRAGGERQLGFGLRCVRLFCYQLSIAYVRIS